MKLEDAKDFIRRNPGAAMADLWGDLLRDSWAEGLLEVQSALEDITIDDLALWTLAQGGPALEKLSQGLEKKGGLGGKTELAPTLGKVAGACVAKEPGSLLDKISSIASDRNLSLLDFLTEARASANLASLVQKNATKQGLYEPIAGAFIAERAMVPVLVLAHADTKLSLRFSPAGEVGVNQKAADPFSKDADLAIVVAGEKVKVFLISHKYARVGGGHQMNQRGDAAKFLAYGTVAKREHSDIPSLRELASKALHRDIQTEAFEWEPGLVLDGEFFENAPDIIRAEKSYPALQGTSCFIGNSDAFVAHLAGPATN